MHPVLRFLPIPLELQLMINDHLRVQRYWTAWKNIDAVKIKFVQHDSYPFDPTQPACVFAKKLFFNHWQNDDGSIEILMFFNRVRVYKAYIHDGWSREAFYTAGVLGAFECTRGTHTTATATSTSYSFRYIFPRPSQYRYSFNMV